MIKTPVELPMLGDWHHLGTVIAFDPGLTTGAAQFHWGKVTWTAQLSYDEVSSWVQDSRADVIVCESFVISNATIRKSQAPWSLELIGLLRWKAHVTGVPFVLQSPSEAKSFSTDRKMKALGLKGGPHESDACRHLVRWLAINGHLDLGVLQLDN